MKAIHNAISKTLFYHFKDSEKPRVLLLGSTRIPALNIGGNTIQPGLGTKPGTELLGLNDRFKAALRKILSEMKFFIRDKLSMVSTDF